MEKDPFNKTNELEDKSDIEAKNIEAIKEQMEAELEKGSAEAEQSIDRLSEKAEGIKELPESQKSQIAEMGGQEEEIEKRTSEIDQKIDAVKENARQEISTVIGNSENKTEEVQIAEVPQQEQPENKEYKVENDPNFKKYFEEQALQYLKNEDSAYFNKEYSGVGEDGYLIYRDGRKGGLPSQNIGGTLQGGAKFSEFKSRVEKEFFDKNPEAEAASRGMSIEQIEGERQKNAADEIENEISEWEYTRRNYGDKHLNRDKEEQLIKKYTESGLLSQEDVEALYKKVEQRYDEIEAERNRDRDLLAKNVPPKTSSETVPAESREIKQENPEVADSKEIKSEEALLEEKKNILLQREEQSYNQTKQYAGDFDKQSKILEDIKAVGIQSFKDLDSLTKKYDVPKSELLSYMAENTAQGAQEEVREYANLLTKEIDGQPDRNARFDTLDAILQNTPAENLKTMMQESTYLRQQLGEMQQAYGGEIGKFMQSTADPMRRNPLDVQKALNYMGTAGRFMNKANIEAPVQTMVSRLLENDTPRSVYQNLNYATLCEAGFSNAVEKILSKGIQEQKIGFQKVMQLKEKGLLTAEQAKNLALVENTTELARNESELATHEAQIQNLKNALNQAEAMAASDPDKIITVEAFGLGKGRAGDLIIKYRERIAEHAEREALAKESNINTIKSLQI